MKVFVVPIVCALFLVSISLIAITGCGRTALITRGPQTTAPPASSQSVDGVPFYVKRAYCRQQASWLEPQFSLDITASVDGKQRDGLGATVVLSRSAYLSRASRDLSDLSGQDINVKTEDGCETFLRAHDDIEVLRSRKMQPVNDSDLENSIEDGDVLLTQNTAQIVPYVDYQTVYYYNTARPVTGTSSAEVKLNADGTLTEASSSINDQTLSTVTGVFSTALSGLLPSSVSSIGPQNELPRPCRDFKGTTLQYSVKRSVAIYRHTHTFKSAETNEIACIARPLKSSAKCADGCSLEITEVPAPKPDSDSSKSSGDDKPTGDKPKPKP